MNAWAMMVAAQGTPQAMQKFLGPWTAAIEPKDRNDFGKLVGALGKGF